jgi:hypothetical protein
MSLAAFSRWTAILSSLFSLVISAAWIWNDAPLPTLTSTKSLETPAFALIASLSSLRPSGARAFLAVVAVTSGIASLLTLLLHFRGGARESVRHLGNAMGWGSLSIVLIFFVSVVEPFANFVANSAVKLVILDTLAFDLFILSLWAYVQFWKLYPRFLSDDERIGFSKAVIEGLVSKERRSFARFYSLFDRIQGLSLVQRLQQPINESIAKRKDGDYWLAAAVKNLFGGGKIRFWLMVTPVVSLFWRSSMMLPASVQGYATVFWMNVVGLFFFMHIFYASIYILDSAKFSAPLVGFFDQPQG